MIGKFIGIGLAVVVLNIIIWSAVIVGGIWLAVYTLRALGVLA